MRGLLTVAFAASFCFLDAATVRAQSTAAWGRPPAPRAPLVPLRADLLRPVGPTTLEDLRVRPEAGRPVQPLGPEPREPDRARPARVCPMPVARPDTMALERMPVGRSAPARAAPMPVVIGCDNPLFR